MRRALLTAKQAAASVTVGNSTDTLASYNNIGAAWGDHLPATATGVLNTATVVMNSASTTDYAIFTVSPAHVVTAITATITADLAAGSNVITLPAPLAVNAGDYIGIWFSATTGPVGFATATGSTRWRTSGVIAKPSAGTTLTVGTTNTDQHWLISATT